MRMDALQGFIASPHTAVSLLGFLAYGFASLTQSWVLSSLPALVLFDCTFYKCFCVSFFNTDSKAWNANDLVFLEILKV